MILNGKFIRSELAKNANGGTEYMAETLVSNVSVPRHIAIHVSRPSNNLYKSWNVLYVHDLPRDPVYQFVDYERFDVVVFVTEMQRASFLNVYPAIRNVRTEVIPNCVPVEMARRERVIRPEEPVKFIYHTTPHRGLEELVAGFEGIRKVFPKATLDVYSSFGVYGWENNDIPYRNLFEEIERRPYMKYHGAKDRETVYAALNEADVFFYPSKWEETSCIALIEAARSGLLCVCNDFGALRETSTPYSNCLMYTGFHWSQFADLFGEINNRLNLTSGRVSVPDLETYLAKAHGLEAFTKSWTTLIESI